MGNVLEHWQLQQLQRLATHDPEKVERVLGTLWEAYPDLYAELAISAVDQESLSVERCAFLLGVGLEEVESRLVGFRQRSMRTDRAVALDEAHVARLIESHVAVWEVVRVHRRLGSLQAMQQSFPSASPGELSAALAYAEDHPEEIEHQIARYEQVAGKLRVEYPFSRV